DGVAAQQKGVVIGWGPVMADAPQVERGVSGVDPEVGVLVPNDEPVRGVESIRVVAIVGVEGEANLRDRRSVLEEQPARRTGAQVEVSRRAGGIASSPIPEGLDPAPAA